MKEYKLPCEECVKTDNHCCLADIPYLLSDIDRIYDHMPDHLNKEDFRIYKRLDFEISKMFILAHKSYNNKVLQLINCVFFKDGKCSIYEYRPEICKIYGTKELRCRYEVEGIKTKEEIEQVDDKDKILKLDEKALEESDIINFKLPEKANKEYEQYKDLVDNIEFPENIKGK